MTIISQLVAPAPPSPEPATKKWPRWVRVLILAIAGIGPWIGFALLIRG